MGIEVMDTAEIVSLFEGFKGPMEDISIVCLSVTGGILAASIIWMAVLCYWGDVSRKALIYTGIWFFAAGPLTFGIAGYALGLASDFQNAYIQVELVKRYGEDFAKEMTLNNIVAKSFSIANSIDINLILKYQAFQWANGVLKYFIPAIYIALGSWSFVKVLDSRIKVEA